MTRIPVWMRWLLAVAALLAAVVITLSLLNWNMLRGVLGQEASALAGRTIQFRGDLKVKLLSWTPGLTAKDVVVGSTPGVAQGPLSEIGQFSVKVKLLPLLIGRVELPLVDFEQPQIWAVRNAGGLSNWRSKNNVSKPTKLPPIQHLVINNGHLELIDHKRRMTLSAQLQSSETIGAGGQGAFELQGRGSLNGDPFLLNLTGGPLIEVRTDQPYHFNAQLTSGQTHIWAKGVLPHPFDFGQVQTALSVSGADLANLYYLIGIALPNTSPYHLSGDLVRDNQKYTFTHVAGTVGRSDLEGEFQVGHDGERPDITANLSSRLLDLQDLAAVVGARAKGRAGSSAAAAQPAAAQPAAAQPAAAKTASVPVQLLPDAHLDLSRVRSTDAVLHYRAESIYARPGLPLRRFRIDLTLDHGLMTADPIAFGFPQGQLAGKIRVDARSDIPQDAVDLKVTNVRLQDFLSKAGAQPPLEGVVEARAKLTGRGDSVHEVAATADGEVTVVVPHGEVRQSLGELLGIGVSRALGLILSKNQSQMGLRCAVADFHAQNGVLDARELVFDSDTVIAKGDGTINLENESLNLAISGRPKSFRLIRIMAPITVTGHLSSPSFGVKPGAVPAQIGAAVALGALFTPVAAILPFVDPGLARDADCVGAVRDAQAMGVPVKASSTTPTNAKAAPAKR